MPTEVPAQLTPEEEARKINDGIQREIEEGARPGHADAPQVSEVEALTATAPEHLERAVRDRSSKLSALFPHFSKE